MASYFGPDWAAKLAQGQLERLPRPHKRPADSTADSTAAVRQRTSEPALLAQLGGGARAATCSAMAGPAPLAQPSSSGCVREEAGSAAAGPAPLAQPSSSSGVRAAVCSVAAGPAPMAQPSSSGSSGEMEWSCRKLFTYGSPPPELGQTLIRGGWHPTAGVPDSQLCALVEHLGATRWLTALNSQALHRYLQLRGVPEVPKSTSKWLLVGHVACHLPH